MKASKVMDNSPRVAARHCASFVPKELAGDVAF